MKKLIQINLYILCLGIIACSPPPKIGVQPYGTIEKQYLDSISSALRRTYAYEVTILPAKELPKQAYTNLKSPRYKADSLLADLKRSKSKEFPYVVGVTNWDICITKKNKDGSIKKPISKYTDFGIFGLGKCPGSVCVLSLFRLRNAENTVTLERIQKIAIHEIGHNHGLKHCPNPGCVMQDAAEKMSTIDQVKPSLCEECLNRIQ